MSTPIYTWCINTYKSLPYLKLAVRSIRENAYYKGQPILVYCENDPETYAWLKEQSDIETIYEENEVPKGIGGGVNECVKRVKTEFFSLIHSDMVISPYYDKPLLEAVQSTPKPLVAGAWRLEPNIWRQPDRIGTVMAPTDTEYGLGMYHHDFQWDSFLAYADGFVSGEAPNFRKVEGVSYMMRTKYFLPNSPVWAPTSLEDHDQSVRMQFEKYDFVILGNALVWHFGARSSHFLGQHDKLEGTTKRQSETERRNHQRWLKIWGEPPTFDEVGFIKATDSMYEIYLKNIDKYRMGDYSGII